MASSSMKITASVDQKFQSAAERRDRERRAKDEKERKEKGKRVKAEIGNHSALGYDVRNTLAHDNLRDDQPELEAGQATPQGRALHSILTPPPSEHSDSAETEISNVAKLQVKIELQRSETRQLRTALESEKQRVDLLQQQKRELEDSHLQAISDDKEQEILKLQRHLERMKSLLKERHDAVKDLEDRLQESERKELDSNRQLHQARLDNQNLETQLALRQMRDLAPNQGLPRETAGLEVAASESGRRSDESHHATNLQGPEHGKTQRRQQASSAPTQRRSSGAYLSVPRGQGRRGMSMFSLSGS